jgi:hypothetical protein
MRYTSFLCYLLLFVSVYSCRKVSDTTIPGSNNASNKVKKVVNTFNDSTIIVESFEYDNLNRLSVYTSSYQPADSSNIKGFTASYHFYYNGTNTNPDSTLLTQANNVVLLPGAPVYLSSELFIYNSQKQLINDSTYTGTYANNLIPRYKHYSYQSGAIITKYLYSYLGNGSLDMTDTTYLDNSGNRIKYAGGTIYTNSGYSRIRLITTNYSNVENPFHYYNTAKVLIFLKGYTDNKFLSQLDIDTRYSTSTNPEMVTVNYQWGKDANGRVSTGKITINAAFYQSYKFYYY